MKNWLKLTSCALILFFSFCGFLLAQDDMEEDLLVEEDMLSEEADFSDVMGGKGGYFHPLLKLSFTSTDNVYETHDDKKADTLTTLTPGFWLASPPSEQQLMVLSVSTTAPGGYDGTREPTDYFKRLQTYVYYSADINRYGSETDKNTENQRLEGLLQYNLKGGLSFELLGQIAQTGQPSNANETTELDIYQSTWIGLMASYFISDDFKLRLDQTSFLIDYNHADNDIKDRTDSATALYLFMILTEKTNIYIEYETISVKYKEAAAVDSTQNQMFVGSSWAITEKSTGKLKVGQSVKTFEDSSIDEATTTTFELSATHGFTEKTTFSATAGQKTEESSYTTYAYVETLNYNLNYSQQFTTEFSTLISYGNTREKSIGATGSTESTENTATTSITLSYIFSDWLSSNAGYTNTAIDAEVDTDDVDTNTFFIDASAAF